MQTLTHNGESDESTSEQRQQQNQGERKSEKVRKNGDDVDDDDKIASLRTKGSRALLALSAIKYYIRAPINNNNTKIFR